MSKLKKTGSSHYEMLYIISNKYTEEEAIAISDKINKLITDKEGKITYNENWGKKKFSYAIKGFSHGYYNLVEFDIKGEEINILDRNLRLANEILRHQIIIKKIKTAEEIKKEQEIEKKIILTKEREEKRAEQDKEKDKKDEKKVDLKDLDEKLDKILEADDLL